MKRKVKKVTTRAMVLVLCIWMLVTMIIMVMGIVQLSRLNSFIATNAGSKVQAKWSARAGVQYALSEIMGNSYSFNNSLDITESLNGVENYKISTSGTFSLITYQQDEEELEYGIIDESSKINLLTASEAQLAELMHVSKDKVRYDLDGVVVRSSFDFTSAKYIKSVLTSKYYAQNIRMVANQIQLSLKDCYGEDFNLNGILDWNENDGVLYPPEDNSDNVLERGLFHNVTLYSYEKNIDEEGNARLNINYADTDVMVDKLEISLAEAMWLKVNRPYHSKAELFPDTISAADFLREISLNSSTGKVNDVGVVNTGKDVKIVPVQLSIDTIRRIYNKITIVDEPIIPGKVNINTANGEVLAAVLGVSRDLADTVIKRRDVMQKGYKSPAEIYSAGILDYKHFIEVVDQLTVQGNVFTIISRGESAEGNLIHIIEATVDISESQPNFIYWREY